MQVLLSPVNRHAHVLWNLSASVPQAGFITSCVHVVQEWLLLPHAYLLFGMYTCAQRVLWGLHRQRRCAGILLLQLGFAARLVPRGFRPLCIDDQAALGVMCN
jgi:hypothetical protein